MQFKPVHIPVAQAASAAKRSQHTFPYLSFSFFVFPARASAGAESAGELSALQQRSDFQTLLNLYMNEGFPNVHRVTVLKDALLRFLRSRSNHTGITQMHIVSPFLHFFARSLQIQNYSVEQLKR